MIKALREKFGEGVRARKPWVSEQVALIVNEVVAAAKKVEPALAAAAPAADEKATLLAEVKQNGFALEYASPALKNDPRIVVEAVKQTGTALHYASEALQNDWRIVVEAVMQNGWALQYSS